MRVLFVVDDLMRGGTQLQTLLTAGALSQRGVQVAVVSLRSPDATVSGPIERARAAGVTVRHVVAARLVATVRRNRPDALVGTMSRSNVLGVLAARTAGIPVIVSRRSLVSTRTDNMVFKALRTWSVRNADAVVANSHAVAQDVSHTEGVEPGRIHVVCNIVERAASASRPAWFPAEPVVVSIGMMRPVKGPDVLVEALCILHDEGIGVSAVMAGDGPARAEIEQRASSLPVVFPGWVERPQDLLAGATVYVQPSRSESTSNALLEAIAADVPVVATDVGDTRRLLADHAVLVAPDDPRALADGIARALRERTRPPTSIVEEMTAEAVGRAYLDVIRGLRRR